MKRDIIKIDEEKCNGCGECVTGCPEGALRVIDGIARVVNESFCDGLGACIGDCPRGAIEIERREAEPYDEKSVVENMLEQGEDVLKAHLEHLKEHGQEELLQEAKDHLEKLGIESPMEEEKDLEAMCDCPSSNAMQWDTDEDMLTGESDTRTHRIKSKLTQWPVQLNLLPVKSPQFDDSDLIITADCVPFAYPNFHQDFLDGNAVIVGCPKLDDYKHYIEKLTEIFKQNDIKSISVVHMEVPCCFGLTQLVDRALEDSGQDIPVDDITISVKGKIKEGR